jgi:hypothetical protein
VISARWKAWRELATFFSPLLDTFFSSVLFVHAGGERIGRRIFLERVRAGGATGQ